MYSSGTTDLLRLLAARLQGNPECRVFPFLDERKTRADESKFYNDVFFPALAEAFPKGLKFAGSRVTHFVGVLWNRASLLVSIALPSLFGLLGTVGTLKMVEFLRKPENRDLLTDIGSFSSKHSDLLVAVTLVLFIIWLMHAWGKVQNSKDALASWASKKLLEDPQEMESGLQERLMHDPQQMLEHLAGERRTLVFLVDDVDCMDGKSVEQLMALSSVAAEKSRRFVMLLCFNPQNPVLLHAEQSFLRQEFEPSELRRKERDEGWRVFEVLPPGVSWHTQD
jgi:hypothetical protein